jgi:hypothetical protein
MGIIQSEFGHTLLLPQRLLRGFCCCCCADWKLSSSCSWFSTLTTNKNQFKKRIIHDLWLIIKQKTCIHCENAYEWERMWQEQKMEIGYAKKQEVAFLKDFNLSHSNTIFTLGLPGSTYAFESAQEYFQLWHISIHSSIHHFLHPSMHSLTHLLIYPSTHLFIHSPISLTFLHSYIHSPIHPPTDPPSVCPVST